MAHISEATYSLLAGATGVTNLVGTRIRRLVIDPVEVTPFLQVQLVSLTPTELLSSNRRPVHAATCEISSWSHDYDTARELAEVVRDTLDQSNNSTHSGVDILSILQIDEEEQAVELAADSVLIRIVQTYEIQYRS